MRKFNNKSISNQKALKSKNKNPSFNFHEKNYATYNSIKFNDFFLKNNNNLDNGNCGNQLEFTKSHNNIEQNRSEVKYQNYNYLETCL
jgi:hypothetical protein